jgi:hypothetical protein
VADPGLEQARVHARRQAVRAHTSLHALHHRDVLLVGAVESLAR